MIKLTSGRCTVEIARDTQVDNITGWQSCSTRAQGFDPFITSVDPPDTQLAGLLNKLAAANSPKVAFCA